jgi:hypothetical protein
MTEKKDDLELTQKLFDLLQGHVPDDCRIAPEAVPNLTPDQAWTVIWWLGNQYWQVTDRIDRCNICGELYDDYYSGECLDWGEPPYHVCDGCTYDEAVVEKREKGNPDG